MNDNQSHHDHGDRIHDLFAQVADDPAPPLGFTAEAIAGVGRRGARTRRLAAVSGATAGIAAVGIAIAALPGAVGSGRAGASPASGGPPASSSASSSGSSSAPSDPKCVADVTNAFADNPGVDNSAARSVAYQECPALRAIDAVLDPAGTHLTELDGRQKAVTPDIAWTYIGYGGEGYNATKADITYSNKGQAAALPSVAVSVTFSLPGAQDPAPLSSDMTLADRAPGVAPGSAPWVEKSSTTLKDGSKVTVGEVQNGDRVSMKARRVLPSGAALTILATDSYDTASATEQPGSVYDPFPFSVEKLVEAASVEQFVAPSAVRSIPTAPGMNHPSGGPSSSGGH
ncbi:hypothetical protein KGQ20_43625 [Catenulispora sp. NF23]|uniref:Uncharacterized protein n=1 Tax=Catenulispora pinistramenti TaxID=2705254 RepID=A0ABS5L7M9_9ACTN|nr:hypothetical protein [Catenulispora pinistramenti]MBS2539655.1 hypothetical protein [Catenulispora pinistramenti]MBS2554381.1 hypothetical protein [Catenulispora pinistramenti]